MIRPLSAVVLLASVVIGGCSSGSAEEAGPCDLLRESDAVELLGGPVERVDFLDYVAASSTVVVEDQPALEAAAERICMYQGEAAGALASVQLDRGLFENEDEFRSAFEEGVEPLEGPGLAANYQTGAGERGATHLGVLLNDEGDSIDLSVSGAAATKEQMIEVAERIADRY